MVSFIFPWEIFVWKFLTCGYIFGQQNFLEIKRLQTMPLASTSIREGAPRRTVGKLARKKLRKPQHRVQLEKKTRKSSLLRRLSGKRASNDIIPGCSSQKQTFMPRSTSSQDGIQLRLVVKLPERIKTFWISLSYQIAFSEMWLSCSLVFLFMFIVSVIAAAEVLRPSHWRSYQR